MNNFLLYDNVMYAYSKMMLLYLCHPKSNFKGHFKQQPLLVVEQLLQWLDPVQLEELQELVGQLQLGLLLLLVLELPSCWLVSCSFLPSSSKAFHDRVWVVLGYKEAQDLLLSHHIFS